MPNTTPAILGTRTNAEENQNNSNSSEIYKTITIENTPFNIIVTDDEIFLALGRWKIKRQHQNGLPYNVDEYRQLVISKDWDLIIDVIGICTEVISL